ncbi:MAG: dihydropteroate synthase [Actinomycetota bacterium]|nr:dihydropteroate synthase [Actinomycetota bacterium]
MATLVMGVLNVTPDSFSDGGRWTDPELALDRGLEMVAEGADVIDVGGESTRPGAQPVDDAEQCRRVLPVIRALAPHVRVSVDTRSAGVAEAAVDAGATLINDVSASLWPVAAASAPEVGWVAMHMQGEPSTMQVDPHYDDVVAEVRAFLVERAAAARADGVTEVWIDPGIGFGKAIEHNLALLAQVDELVTTGLPVLVGASRKGFLGTLLGGASSDDRLEGSLAVAVWTAGRDVGMVRVHDVAATVDALRLAGATTAGPA